MARTSSAPVVLAVLLSSGGLAEGQALTCDAAQIRADSYRLATDAQALNVTRPRTDWWDGFDATLLTHREALDDLNGGALAIAERALALDPRNLLARSQVARQLVIDGLDGGRARDEIRRVFDAGGAVVWTATLYDVDARDYFLVAFTAHGVAVYRFGEAVGAVVRGAGGVPEFPGPEASAFWRAWGGCLDALRPEAEIPWDDVYEMAAGNYVVDVKFRTPVSVAGDRGRRRTLRALKMALHGAMGTVEYLVSPDSRPWRPPSVRGIGIGPTAYQDRIRRTLAAIVDPGGRIALPKARRGAGW
ncbi:MAG: hypothetical protein AB1635_12315 [Acidobacteriota bacterium]